MNTEPRRPDTEYRTDSLAAGIKATGGQGEERGEEKGEERVLPSDPGGGRAFGPPLGGTGEGVEAKGTPHDDRETANRIPIWVVEEDVGDGLPSERTYSHSSLGLPVGYVVMPVGMHAVRHADHIRFYAVPPKPGAYSVVLAYLSTWRAVEAAIGGEFGLSWRPRESSAPPSDRGGGAGAGHGEPSASASSLSSLFAQHQKAALDLYDAIYRQAEAVVGRVAGGPLVQVEALANEVRGLRDSLSATVAERDALMNLIVQPWARDGDGGGDGDSTQLWKINLAWWETATSREEGVAMARKAAGLEAKP